MTAILSQLAQAAAKLPTRTCANGWKLTRFPFGAGCRAGPPPVNPFRAGGITVTVATGTTLGLQSMMLALHQLNG